MMVVGLFLFIEVIYTSKAQSVQVSPMSLYKL